MSFSDLLGSIFADALMEIVLKISGISLSVTSSEPYSDFDGVIGLMNLGGHNSMTVFISASEADMRVLCSLMIGVPKDDITKEDIDDALCELVNMTAGNAKLRLGNTDYTFTLSTPFVIRGDNMSIVTKKRARVVSKLLDSEEMSMKLKIIKA